MKNFFVGCFTLMVVLALGSENIVAAECESGSQCSEKSLKRNDRDRDRDNSGNGSSRGNRGSTRPTRDTGTTRPARNTGTTRPARNTGSTRPARNTGTTRPARNTGTTRPARNTGTTRPARNRGTVRPTRPTQVNTSRRTTGYRNYGHRPSWNRVNVRFTRHIHSSRRYNRTHHNRWNSRRNYFSAITYRDIYWDRWLRTRVTWNDGYYWHNNYPWYTYNGYSHRYSNVDTCDYELVDGFNNTVERTYYNYTCSFGYDQCADQRDQMNNWSNDYRYFCSERLEGNVYDYNYDYNDDFYSDVYDDSYDGYGGTNDDWDQDFNNNWN